MHPKFKTLQKIVFIVFIITMAFCLIAYAIWGQNLSLQELQNTVKDFGIWAPIAFIAFYTLGTIFIPSTPFMVLAGLMFGFGEGLLYTIMGGFLNSIVVFEISRRLGKDWVEGILQNKYMKKLGDYNKRLESGAIWDLIILRILPIMPFNVLNILMGVSRIKLRDYIIGTILGLAPSNIISVYFGNILTKLF